MNLSIGKFSIPSLPQIPIPAFLKQEVGGALVIRSGEVLLLSMRGSQVVNRVRVNWYSLIPEIARLGKKGRVVIIFTISENGTIQDFRLVANSGTEPLDRAAMGAITASNPFAKLPANYDGDHIVLQFTFLYNIR